MEKKQNKYGFTITVAGSLLAVALSLDAGWKAHELYDHKQVAEASSTKTSDSVTGIVCVEDTPHTAYVPTDYSAGSEIYRGTYQDYSVTISISKKCKDRFIELKRPGKNHINEDIVARDMFAVNHWTSFETTNSFNGVDYDPTDATIEETGMTHFRSYPESDKYNGTYPQLRKQLLANIDLADKAFAAVHQPQYLTKE